VDADAALRSPGGRSRPVARLLHRRRLRGDRNRCRHRVRDLTMLKLPDDDFVTIELVSGSSRGGAPGGSGLNHFVIKVESLAATTADLAAAGLDVEPPESPTGTDDFLTTWITDPDGNRIELVQWPAGHADGITAADWPG